LGENPRTGGGAFFVHLGGGRTAQLVIRDMRLIIADIQAVIDDTREVVHATRQSIHEVDAMMRQLEVVATLRAVRPLPASCSHAHWPITEPIGRPRASGVQSCWHRRSGFIKRVLMIRGRPDGPFFTVNSCELLRSRGVHCTKVAGSADEAWGQR